MGEKKESGRRSAGGPRGQGLARTPRFAELEGASVAVCCAARASGEGTGRGEHRLCIAQTGLVAHRAINPASPDTHEARARITQHRAVRLSPNTRIHHNTFASRQPTNKPAQSHTWIQPPWYQSSGHTAADWREPAQPHMWKQPPRHQKQAATAAETHLAFRIPRFPAS